LREILLPQNYGREARRFAEKKRGRREEEERKKRGIKKGSIYGGYFY
jgi:hypothetical protein